MRWFVFPFYSGSGAGILWSTALIFLTIAMGVSCGLLLDSMNIVRYRTYAQETFEALAVNSFVIIFYCLVVFYVTRSIKSPDLRNKSWFIVLMALTAMTLFSIFLDEAFHETGVIVCFFNPFGALLGGNDSGTLELIRPFAISLCAAVGLLSLKHIYPQLIQFRRSELTPTKDKASADGK